MGAFSLNNLFVGTVRPPEVKIAAATAENRAILVHSAQY